MQPGAPGRSSSVSERRPRRGGGGGGDGGGAAGRRHQTEPSQLERLPLAAACSSGWAGGRCIHQQQHTPVYSE